MARFRISLLGLIAEMVAASALLGLWLVPVELETSTEVVRSYGWPIKTCLVWVYHGGRYHPYESRGTGIILLFDIIVCGACLWLIYWGIGRVAVLHPDGQHPESKKGPRLRSIFFMPLLTIWLLLPVCLDLLSNSILRDVGGYYPLDDFMQCAALALSLLAIGSTVWAVFRTVVPGHRPAPPPDQKSPLPPATDP